MLRLSHLLFSPRTWHLIDGTLLSMQIASPWLIFMFVCGKNVWKNGGFFWHFKLQLGQFHPAGCVGWGLGVFPPAPHEMPSPAAGSSCCSAVQFLSLISLPAPVSLGLLAGERAPLCSFLLGYGGAKCGPERMLFIFCPFLFCLNPRASCRYNVFGTGCPMFPLPMLQIVAKFCVNRPCAHIPFVFSVRHGNSDQPSVRERFLTSLLKQPSSLPLLHTHNFKTNVCLWCKIC